MTCKDCLHYKRCKTLAEEIGTILDDTNKMAEKICSHFKDKSRFIEVVRCFECQHKVDINGRVMCKRSAQKSQYYDEWEGLTATTNNHFCSYGERKE